MTRTSEANVSTGMLASPYSRHHPRTVAVVRVAVAVWLLALAGFFSSRGYYWGLALVAPAALHLWLASRLRTRVQGQH